MKTCRLFVNADGSTKPPSSRPEEDLGDFPLGAGVLVYLSGASDGNEVEITTPLCGVPLWVEESYVSHAAEERTMKCDKCDRSFITGAQLRLHQAQYCQSASATPPKTP